MEISILECLAGAKAARGLAVIIDVFRAFSLECHLFARGADRVLAVGELNAAYALRERYPNALLIGERQGFPLPGFDCGNSPALIRSLDIAGRTVIHTTSAGTQGIAAAEHAAEIITGSLVNARAVADYILSTKPERVSLVAMGVGAAERAEEDLLCARYIRAMLLKEAWDETIMAAEIEGLKTTTGKRFFDPATQGSMPEADFRLCTERDIFPFVIRATKKEGFWEMEAVPIGQTIRRGSETA